MERLKQVLFEKEYQLNNLSEVDIFTKKHRKLLKEVKVLKKAIKILNVEKNARPKEGEIKP